MRVYFHSELRLLHLPSCVCSFLPACPIACLPACLPSWLPSQPQQLRPCPCSCVCAGGGGGWQQGGL